MTALHDFRAPAATPLRWRLATGPGGVGKSRMALEYCFALGPAWYAGFFDATDTHVDWATWQPVAPTLIIADYAQRQAKSTDKNRVGLDTRPPGAGQALHTKRAPSAAPSGPPPSHRAPRRPALDRRRPQEGCRKRRQKRHRRDPR